jgi:hypothetical protein
MSNELKIRLLSQPRVASQLGKQMQLEYGAEQIGLFADVLADKLTDLDPVVAKIAEAFAIDRFNGAFNVGMTLNHADAVDQSIAKANEFAVALGLVEVPVVEEPQVVVPETTGEPSGDVIMGSEPAGNAPNNDGPNKPSDYTATPIDALPIHGTAKKAYKQAGLLTVGDLEAFAASRNLSDVKGVADSWAEDTLAAIKTLKGE